MVFYKIDVFTFEEKEHYHNTKERLRFDDYLSSVCEEISIGLADKGEFFFVGEHSNEYKFGVIMQESFDLYKCVDTFVEIIGERLKEINVRVVSYNKIKDMKSRGKRRKGAGALYGRKNAENVRELTYKKMNTEWSIVYVWSRK